MVISYIVSFVLYILRDSHPAILVRNSPLSNLHDILPSVHLLIFTHTFMIFTNFLHTISLNVKLLLNKQCKMAPHATAYTKIK